mmetsp:Transcript_8942/g.17499  ORF Transcript_8942/g.17499 Transcript_8942/m.17499 type:complete len:225 (-) Transcript_8942:75-749(-)|eukprot:CAMPEP_0170169908 /NCGR_PEP_ID=MMETSP0040_2-20121228/2854_1 /TAXON_ID=641309 /ORGANISM="Lotharella oceanica, Strain CCMP622" /LENGTH=224 /DNA_ID=CAMNT_0010408937 /DNA_START=43 /DNA_END=717 /DNA_ORIENTATION=-
MRTRFGVFATLACIVAKTALAYDDDDDDFSLVTCGSTLKLKHRTGYHLHSHDINWGSGSGQQSVTAMKSSDDSNSLWTIASPAGEPICPQGTPIKCGSMVRLVHHNTKKHLHSHRHASPVSHRFEISGYGNAEEGHSDSGDNWRVDCDSHTGFWQRDSKVKFMHADTGGCLFAQKEVAFTNQNCRGCPIIGQLEVCGLQNCAHVSSPDAMWKASDGIFFPKRSV